MTARPFLLATGALALVALGFVAPGEDAVPPPENAAPHARPPAEIDVTIHDDAWVVVSDYDSFEEWAEAEPDRFEFVEGLLEPKDEDGEVIDTFDGYRDRTGHIVLRYDSDSEDVAYFERIDAERLTRGYEGYVQYCASCHGFDGAGYGRSAQHLRPPPRDFHTGKFKFAKVGLENLPSDQALLDLVKKGLNGTPMLPWALTDNQLLDIIQYIKSLSPPETGWRDVYAVVRDPIELGDDPWAADPQAGIDRGEVVYHQYGCYNCHPGYVTPVRLDEILVSVGSPARGNYREDLSYPKIVPNTLYEVQGYATSILPPDFTWHTLRAARDMQGNLSAEEIARVVGSGIAGSGMPQWKGTLEDEDLWAMGYYVKHLVEAYRGDPAARAEFMASLRADNGSEADR